MPTSQVQPSNQATLRIEQPPPSTQQQESKCVMISKGDRAAAMVQLADMTMCVLNHMEPYAGDSSTASSLAGEYPNIGLGAAECVTTCNQSAGPSCIDVLQPDAACISTDLKFDIWANELINDSDRDFILTGIQEGFDLIQRDANVLPASQRITNQL
ncbi:hypothetical protein OS493_010684 [Desmophyllum pertusum]|uniref:Uncharacterized protein n=1 Tax=Desmophyllum pertusum TaxID=174260 RepID=A0A9X0D644_9CNID|nr:hypothetical protein OS493_010684 [Desmophyllum pertusum]